MDTRAIKGARSAVDLGTMALWLVAIFAPIIDQCVRPESAREPLNENRKTRPKPRLPRTPREVTRFPAAFENHHADTFGLRDVLLRWNSLFKLSVFHIPPAEMLVLDDSGWVDYAGEHTMEVLRGTLPMSVKEIDVWRDYLELCRDFCARNQSQYLFVTAPNKESIYPEHVPARFTRLGPSRMDQLVAALPPALKSSFVDPRAAFVAARAEDRPPWDMLYNIYGTHWNGRGTWVEYQQIMRALEAVRDDVHALTDKDVEWIVDAQPSADTWGPRLYLPDRFQHPSKFANVPGQQLWHEVESVMAPVARWRVRNASAKGPRVLVFHDSFGPALEIPFANTFSEATFVHTWFDPALVLSERPDVVMEVRVERIFVSSPILLGLAKEIMEQEAPPLESGSLVLAIDASAPDSQLTATGLAHVERTADGLVFRVDDGKAGWMLPEFTLPPDQRAWLHIEFESTARGMLVAYRKSNATGEWLRHDAAYLPFAAGHQERAIALPGPSGKREIRLHLGGAPTQVLVKRIEVRATGS